MNIKDKNTRVLNITHYDLDGIISHIVLINYYNKVYCLPTTYNTEKLLNAKVSEIINDYDIIICTDFYPEFAMEDLKKYNKPIYVLDHHETMKKYHNGKNIMIDTSQAACRLTYEVFNRFTNLTHLIDLVTLGDDFDMHRLKDKRSPEFNKLFWEMGLKWFNRRFSNGNIKLYPEEIQFIKDSIKDIEKIYESLPITELPHKGVLFDVTDYQYEITEKLRNDGYQWILCVNKNNISIRSNDNIDLVPVINKLGKGGGHKNAAGIPIEYRENPATVIKNIINAFNAVYPNL